MTRHFQHPQKLLQIGSTKEQSTERKKRKILMETLREEEQVFAISCSFSPTLLKRCKLQGHKSNNFTALNMTKSTIS